MRGRGWLLRLARLILGTRAILLDIGSGTYIEGSLDDWMIVWAFMCRHEADAPFQTSLDLVRPGQTVFDIGANVGIWSLLAAKRGAHVYAFEPVTSLRDRLRAHASLNELCITIHGDAVGAETSTTSFFESRSGNSGASSLRRSSGSDVEWEVPVITLDGYIERERLERIDFVKVDVEGAELLVFRGAAQLLASSRAPKIFFELDAYLCERFGATPGDVKQFLADCGYGIYRWESSEFRMIDGDDHRGHEDLFALKGLP
jgi:FkbM family methyltransferase